MKKEKSPIVVILTMFLLSLFIILPPIFRSAAPKQETKSNNENLPKLHIVNCNKIYATELIQAISKTKYNGTAAISNTIIYQKISSLPSGYQAPQTPDTITALDEMTYFKGIANLSYTEAQDKVTVIINKQILKTYPTEERLANYLKNSYLEQKKSYEAMGYKCNVMES